MRQKRDATGRNTVFLCTAAMTLLLMGLLLFHYIKYDRPRTLHHCLELIDGDPLTYSEDSGFFEEAFVLYLNADERVPQEDTIEIRYTVNGDEPAQDSLLYTDGIDLGEVIRKMEEEETAQAEAADEASSEEDHSIEGQRRQWEEEKKAAVSAGGQTVEQAADGIRVIPVRARLLQGEDASTIVTRTYVMGPGVFERYDAYVACVSTDSYNLFDYDNGIMVRGSHYQKDIDNGVRQDRSGNFYQEGDEWIKNGHVTLFSPEGRVLLEEDTGIRVGGYSSRGLSNRSLRLEASTEKGSSDNYFHLDLFKNGSYSRAGNLETLMEGTSGMAGRFGLTAGSLRGSGAASVSGRTAVDPDSFQALRLRTHGVPVYRIRSVRSKYAKILADESGMPGIADSRLGITYLNGEFYTLCDLTPAVNKDYMCTLFGLGTPDAIEKYDSSDYDIYTRTKILPLLNADLTQAENQKALEEKVDMDNYLSYFAAEVLFNNCDWPFNNVTMWRYVGEEDPDNPYTDGRYRFILDDMDQILTNDLHSMPDQWSTELIDYLMKDKGNTFCHVMQCKRYRDTFLTYVDDLLNTTFDPDYACPILEALYADMKREYLNDYGENFWTEMEDTIAKTINNVREKEGLYRQDIAGYMGLEDRYKVTLVADGGASLTWNNMTVSQGETWSNQYYRGTSFTVTAHPAQGYRFVGWEINGRAAGEYTSETLDISDALLAEDPSGGDTEQESFPQVRIRAVTEPAG